MSGRIRPNVRALQRMLRDAAIVETAAQVVAADQRLVRFLNGAGGAFPLPLLAVAYAGSKTNSRETARIAHTSNVSLAVIVVTQAVGAQPGELDTLHDLVDAVSDALAGAVPYLTDTAGNYLDADGAITTTPAIDGVPIGDAIECAGDEPFPLPDAKTNLIAWSIALRFEQGWKPDRDEVTAPEEFEQIAGAAGPFEAVEPDDDVMTDNVGVDYDDAPTD